MREKDDDSTAVTPGVSRGPSVPPSQPHLVVAPTTFFPSLMTKMLPTVPGNLVFP